MRLSFYILILGFLAGVMWRSLCDIGVAGMGALFVGALFVFVLSRIERYRHTLYIALALFACVVGVVRTEMAERAYESARVYADGSEFAGGGVVVAEPDVRDGYTVLWIDSVSTLGREVRVRAKVPPYPVYEYGDRVEARGTLVVPHEFESDTGRIFNYPGYLQKDGVHYELRDAVVKQAGGNVGNPIVRGLLSFKHAWLATVSRLIPEPSAALAGGIIVGAKRSLGDMWLALFRTTGIIHIVVLSGYNLTLVANVIIQMTRRFPKRVGCILGVCGVVCFALMVGGGATVVRASMMAIIGMLALYVTRPYVVARALALAAFLMVLWNPFVLVYDTGFQLSFMATVGLVFGAPLLVRYFRWVPESFKLREIVAATFATQLAVLPILLYQIGQVSLVAPIVNVLVLPVISLAMLTGFLAGMCGMVVTALGVPFAWATHAILSYVFMVVGFFGHLPFAAVTLPPVSWWSIACLYVVLGAVVLSYRNFKRIPIRAD